MTHFRKSHPNERIATVHGFGDPDRDPIGQYLPSNYRVTVYSADGQGQTHFTAVIRGVDKAGWTLEDYVIPRLASGMYTCHEHDPDLCADCDNVAVWTDPVSDARLCQAHASECMADDLALIALQGEDL